jgi:hypothetical protein
VIRGRDRREVPRPAPTKKVAKPIKMKTSKKQKMEDSLSSDSEALSPAERKKREELAEANECKYALKFEKRRDDDMLGPGPRKTIEADVELRGLIEDVLKSRGRASSHVKRLLLEAIQRRTGGMWEQKKF